MMHLIRLVLLFTQGLMLSVMMEAVQLDNGAKMLYALGMGVITGIYGGICAADAKMKDVKDE